MGRGTGANNTLESWLTLNNFKKERRVDSERRNVATSSLTVSQVSTVYAWWINILCI